MFLPLTNPDPADLLGDMDFELDTFHDFVFVGFKMFGLPDFPKHGFFGYQNLNLPTSPNPDFAASPIMDFPIPNIWIF